MRQKESMKQAETAWALEKQHERDSITERQSENITKTQTELIRQRLKDLNFIYFSILPESVNNYRLNLDQNCAFDKGDRPQCNFVYLHVFNLKSITDLLNRE